jgi:alkanesulfonate monooxygenase SsuD/methylene tetrahydromethanopterin reductase-like flavin-dependent oxidoreductase (luciferase family)
MTVIGLHNSHEQVHPSDLLRAVQHAEDVGFTAAMCSDHLEPWNERQGHSGFAWSWLGAALATTGLPFGAVTAPGQRYHPVIIAQAIATLPQLEVPAPPPAVAIEPSGREQPRRPEQVPQPAVLP